MIDFEDYNKKFYEIFKEALSDAGEDEFDIEIQIDNLREVVSTAINNCIDYLDETPINIEQAMPKLKAAMQGKDLPENNLELFTMFINEIDFNDETETKRAFYKELARAYLIEIFRLGNNQRLSNLIGLINIQQNNEDKNKNNERTN